MPQPGESSDRHQTDSDDADEEEPPYFFGPTKDAGAVGEMQDQDVRTRVEIRGVDSRMC